MAVALRVEAPAETDHRKIETVFPAPGAKELPVQPTIELERLYRKQRLAAGYRLFARYGFEMGGAGHITARDPEWTDPFWVNPFGVHFSQVCVSNLIRCDHHGEVVEGRHPVNRAAFAIHSALHQARPDVIAAAHSHSLYGKSWSTLGRLLDPLTQDACAFHEDHALFDDYTGVVVDPEEGKRLAHELGAQKAIILKNHGILTVGHTIEETVFWYVTMERTCEVELIARAAGEVQPMAADTAALTAAETMTGFRGRTVHALPLDALQRLMDDFHRQ